MMRQQNGHKFGRHSDYKNGKQSEDEPQDKNESLIEKRIGLFGLLLCLFVLATKVLCASHNDIYDFIFEKKLTTYETMTEDGKVMIHHAWITVAKYSSIWLPPLCGILMAYFTALFVYLDSSVPGVQPPSPFSPTKYKVQSGHTFHLNYIIAVIMGALVTCYMYWRQSSIEY